MDYPLGAKHPGVPVAGKSVLIPILMDYPLGVSGGATVNAKTGRLNPYSNGLPSRGQDYEWEEIVITQS